MVTEIGGWVDRFSATGRLKWSIKAPTDYPSDAQLLSVALFGFLPALAAILDSSARGGLYIQAPAPATDARGVGEGRWQRGCAAAASPSACRS